MPPPELEPELPEPAGPCVPLPPIAPVGFGVVVLGFMDPLAPVGVGVLDIVPLLLPIEPLLPIELPLLPMELLPMERFAQPAANAAAMQRPSRAGTRAYFLETIGTPEWIGKKRFWVTPDSFGKPHARPHTARPGCGRMSA